MKNPSGSRQLLRTGMLTLTGIATALVVAACSSADAPTAPLTSARTLASWGDSPLGYIRACKAGGPAGTYSFTLSQSGGGTANMPFGTSFTLEFDGSTVVCKSVWGAVLDGTWEEGETADVTITEVLGADMTVPQIEIYNVILPYPGYVTTLYNTNSVTVTTDPFDRFKLNFYNAVVPPPPSGFGCTPGYWKAKQHWDSWAATGLTTTQTVGSLFSNAALYGLGSATLIQGLSFQGGSTLTGAAEILLRAAIAAQLNARHPEIGAPISASDMITSVNAALASGDRDTMLGLATQLDDNNNAGCTLD